MEKLINEKCTRYYIFRLPQVVGPVDNNTLIPSFVRNIQNGNEIKIHKNALRNLIDIDDVARVSKNIIDSRPKNPLTCDIASEKSVSPEFIAQEIGKILNIPPKLKSVDMGETTPVHIKHLKSIIPKDDIIFKQSYWKDVLKKYVELLCRRFYT